MTNIKIILYPIILIFGIITSIIIVNRNSKNITNILFGLMTFIGGVVAIFFALIKEILYPLRVDLAIIFSKISYVSIFLLTILSISFSIFFWKSKYKKIPNYLHFLSFIPMIIFTLWIFIYDDSVIFFQTPWGVNNYLYKPLMIYSVTLLLMVIVPIIFELRYMAKMAAPFKRLKFKMNLFTFGIVLGFGGVFFSVFLFQYYFFNFIDLSSYFALFSLFCLTLAFTMTISKDEKHIWHGCPKLLIEKNGVTYCINSPDGYIKEIKVLDLGNIVERIQIDSNVLKTELDNCTNIIFSDDKDIVKCLTTHLPITVLNEDVTREEMELAREMRILNGHELCSDCLHKIIAYRKQNKDISGVEIKRHFLGIRAEEFFGEI